MKPYLFSPKERVRHWREFRLSFEKEETDLEQVSKTMIYWQESPIQAYFLDVDFPKKWPTPWELIMGGDFCPSSLAYMMEQTLLMSDDRWSKDRLQLMFVDDLDSSEMKMILVIDDKYVANYLHGDIINFDIVQKNCIIQNKYKSLARHKHKIVKKKKY